MYDIPARSLSESYEMEVIDKAEVHGIEGVEITVKTHTAVTLLRATCRARLTFLDGDSFLGNCGFDHYKQT